MTAISTYFLTKELWNSRAGLFAACFIAIGTAVLMLFKFYSTIHFRGFPSLSINVQIKLIYLYECLKEDCATNDPLWLKSDYSGSL